MGVVWEWVGVVRELVGVCDSGWIVCGVEVYVFGWELVGVGESGWVWCG